MLITSVFSFVAVLFFTSIRASLSSSIRLRLQLESHHLTLAGKAARLFISQTTRVSLTIKWARSLFLTVWALSVYLICTHPDTSAGAMHAGVFTILISVFIFFVSDLVVANLSSLHPYALLRLLAPLFLFTYIVCWPLTSLLYWCRQQIFSKAHPRHGDAEKRESKSEDFEDLVNSMNEGHSEQVPFSEVQILQNALDFQDVKAGSCMIPRSEVVAMEINSSVDDLIAKFTSTRLTRILIYRESIENIIGYVHSFELFRKPVSVISMVRPVVVVPETTPIRELLTLFIKQHRNIALVIDEYGGTSGILTMEDVIEELFGEIDDEHDSDEHLEKRLNEKEYLLSARLEVDYLNEKYGFSIPVSPDYTTLGGFVFHLGQGLPRPKQKLFHEHLRFEVVEMNANRVETVKLSLK
jgi:putative hemolysin